MKRSVSIILIIIITALLSVNVFAESSLISDSASTNHLEDKGDKGNEDVTIEDIILPSDYLKDYQTIEELLTEDRDKTKDNELIDLKLWFNGKIMKYEFGSISEDDTDQMVIATVKLDDESVWKVYVDHETKEGRLALMPYIGINLTFKGYYRGHDEETNNNVMYLESFYDVKNKKEYESVFGEEYTEFINTVFITDIKHPESLELIVGEEMNPTFKIEPKDATHTDIVLSSDNEEIISIEEGMIKALSKGECTVVATVEKDGYSFEMPVTVNNPPLEKVSINGFDSLTRETRKGLTFEHYPENADINEVEWKSSNENILTVNPEGEVKGISVGKASVTLTVNGKVKDSIKMEVLPIEVSSIDLKDKKVQIKYGETYESEIVIIPSVADDKTVTWKIADKKIASVDKNGVIKAVDIGETEITAICNGIEDTMVVEVLPPDLKTIELDCEGWDKNKKAYVVEIGDTLETKIKIHPKNADVSDIKYVSSDSKKIKVDENGIITGALRGNATIKVTCNGIESNEIEVYALDSDSLAMLKKYGDENYYEELVYISANGKKYHSRPGCSNMKNPQEVTINEAERRGKTPCAKCY